MGDYALAHGAVGCFDEDAQVAGLHRGDYEAALRLQQLHQTRQLGGRACRPAVHPVVLPLRASMPPCLIFRDPGFQAAM